MTGIPDERDRFLRDGIGGHDPESSVTIDGIVPRVSAGFQLRRVILPDFLSREGCLPRGEPMRKIKDVLRLKFEAGLSHERIAAAIGVSKGAVSKYVQRAARGRARLAAAAGARRRARSRRCCSRTPRRWRHGYAAPDFAHDPPGAQAQGRHAAAAVGGVRAAHPGGVPLQPVLLALSDAFATA